MKQAAQIPSLPRPSRPHRPTIQPRHPEQTSSVWERAPAPGRAPWGGHAAAGQLTPGQAGAGPVGAERDAVFLAGSCCAGAGAERTTCVHGTQGCPHGLAANRVPLGRGSGHHWLLGVGAQRDDRVRGRDALLTSKRFAKSHKNSGTIDQGHMQVVAEAGAGGRFPYALLCRLQG